MDEVERRARGSRVSHRGTYRADLRLDGTGRREELDTGLAGEMERRGAALDEEVVLGVHRDEHPETRRRCVQREVLVSPLDEALGDHEHLEAGVTVGDKGRQLRQRSLARIRDDAMEGEIAERRLGVAQPAVDTAAQRAALLV